MSATRSSRNCLICLFCGLPGAGKTTFAKYLQESCVDGYHFIHVSYDLLMPSVNVHEVNAWKDARIAILKNIENILQFIKNGEGASLEIQANKYIRTHELQSLLKIVSDLPLEGQIVILIDDNMQYRGMRHEYYQLCCKLSVSFSIVYFDVPLEKCLENNEKRNAVLPDYVIKKLYTQLEVPGTSSKCKWEKYIFVIEYKCMVNNFNGFSFEDFYGVLRKSFEDPQLPLQVVNSEDTEVSHLENRKNFIHQADICMRKFISSKMNSCKLHNPDSNMQILAKKLNFVKRELLSLLKSGYIDESFALNNDGIINAEILQGKIDCLMSAEME